MADEYIVHKPADIKTVHVNRRTELMNGAVQSYWVLPKYDGCCVVVKLYPNGGFEMLSRTGKPYQSVTSAAREMATRMSALIAHHNGVVVIGEAWHPDYGHNEISGEFRRGEESPWLNVMAFDCIPLEDYEAGKCSIPYSTRRTFLNPLAQGQRAVLSDDYGSGFTLDALQALTNKLTASKPKEGGMFDGAIATDPNGTWERGAGKTGEWLKFKRLLSFDLRVLEVNTEIGEKTGRTVYKLVVNYNGKRLGVGSGLPHSADKVPKVGDIVEINAMDESADGLLREPRFKSIRFDKTKADFE